MKNFFDLSVVVSTYNQVDYISECLDSIINAAQGISCEVIIADDCSTDGTTDICVDFQKKYPLLISFLEGVENLGGNKNYLRAHSVARGKFVSHVDGDDVVAKNKFIEQLICFADQDVNLVVHSSMYYSDKKIFTHVAGLKNIKNGFLKFRLVDLAAWGPIAVHSSYMYRRSALKLDNIKIPFMEWIIGMELLKNGCGIFLEKPLIYYRYNPGGQAWTASKSGRAKAYEIHFNDIQCIFEKNDKLRVHLYSQVLTNLIGIIRSKTNIPEGMMYWLLSKFLYFRPGVFYKSILMRVNTRPVEFYK